MRKIIEDLAAVAEEVNSLAETRIGMPLANVSFDDYTEALVIDISSVMYDSETQQAPIDVNTCRLRALIDVYRVAMALEHDEIRFRHLELLLVSLQKDLDVVEVEARRPETGNYVHQAEPYMQLLLTEEYLAQNGNGVPGVDFTARPYKDGKTDHGNIITATEDIPKDATHIALYKLIR